MDDRTEFLVLVDDAGRYAATVEQWRRSATVTQLLPPRLALVVLPPGAAPEQVFGVGTRWFGGDVPEVVLRELSEAELLFVAAWRQRRRPKIRPGDGLPWDAPGYQPPDRR